MMSGKLFVILWSNAKTCVLGSKLFVYYTDETNSTGIVFSHMYELRGLIADGDFSLESHTPNQKMSVDSLVKKAYANWNQFVEYDGKVLNSLTNTKKGSTSLTIHHNYAAVEQQHATSKNRLPYVSIQTNQHFQTSNNYTAKAHILLCDLSTTKASVLPSRIRI
ncbi:hypothetical protein RJT34_32737 [Clitoria ternatea]|uniref:Calmodulin binding protein C-terminal domain-containing protein n=1 Tax=Clitoria ternatea TaxID=43366 RepID=A0AAN9I9T2_CLITE